ncbi:MAG: diaminopimelate epimerase [Chitinophagaceae bacterium]|nr:diaminopimelate epimerase [Chitinophagaceae bacterium]
MIIDFYKYQGTGNDFVILDNRDGKYSAITREQVAFICNRHFGIGADGLMMLQLKQGYDFKMVYFNADGGESSMCGNGGRCLTAFAKELGVINGKARFIAVDGEHIAIIHHNGIVELKMQDVTQIERYEDHCVLNTGSPHYIKWVSSTDSVNVYDEGRAIRYNKKFGHMGINVNFAEIQPSLIKVRTYERGVEDETLSCGTGVTASAIAASTDSTEPQTITVSTPGGILSVKFKRTAPSNFEDVWLCGPAQFVYRGTMQL